MARKYQGKRKTHLPQEEVPALLEGPCVCWSCAWSCVRAAGQFPFCALGSFYIPAFSHTLQNKLPRDSSSLIASSQGLLKTCQCNRATECIPSAWMGTQPCLPLGTASRNQLSWMAGSWQQRGQQRDLSNLECYCGDNCGNIVPQAVSIMQP